MNEMAAAEVLHPLGEQLSPRSSKPQNLVGWLFGGTGLALFALMATTAEGGQGQFNLGGYSNPKFDALVKQIASEIDNTKRQALIREAFKIHQDDIGHIPLHQQMLTWGMKQNVDLVQLANSFNYLRWVTIR